MSSAATLERQPSYFPENYSLSNWSEPSQTTSPSSSVFLATVLGVTAAFAVQSYQSKDVHITPGQVSSVMDSEGNSILVRSMWPSPSSAWVERMLESCRYGEEDSALKEISSVTTDYKSSGKIQQLADDLANLMSAKLPDIVLIGLLRNTYSIRAHIPSWNALLVQTERILISHKKNPRALLRGLKSYS